MRQTPQKKQRAHIKRNKYRCQRHQQQPNEKNPARTLRRKKRRRIGYTYTYDQENRLTKITIPAGAVEKTYQYDLKGNITQETDPAGKETRYL